MKNLLQILSIIIFCGCPCSCSNESAKKAKLDQSPQAETRVASEEFRRYYSTVKKYFDSTLFNRGFSGQVLVAKNGKIIFDETSGFADFKTKDTLYSNTPLHIASAGKTFTGMAILHLYEAGKLNLDDTLGKFFPAFPYSNVTVKMLLSHRSGLPNYLYYLSELKISDTCYSNHDVLNSLYSLKPGLEFASGRRFAYSNTNYVLLALIVEKITGESFPVYMKKTFFDSLQMTNTFICCSNDPSKITPSFQGNGRYYPMDQYDCTYGDKNLYSTANDLYKWDQALRSGKLFKKETLDSAYTPLSNERPSVHNYGLGWRMMNFKNGKKLIYHNGRWHGSNASFVRLLDEDATIIVIGNKFSWKIYSAAMKAANIFGSYYPDANIPQSDEEEDSLAAETVTTSVISPALAIKSVETKR